ncbi:MAG: CRISPR-associated RAMP protein [Elusimicrobia bacterium RIFCSPLOWO2_12_FULL_59_9]|nr:MAG: CRISPR-associated RAMP protein [Elusimicrobia bacterium RIFCSPLOWO2_12_FULL_59_9]
MFDRFESRVTLTGRLTAQTALRIGAGRATRVMGTDLPVVRDAVGKPYIPGSSFKGVLRASVEAIVRSVVPHRKGACLPVNEGEQCILRGAPGTNEARAKNQTWTYPQAGVPPHEKVGIRDLQADLPGELGKRDQELARRVQDESCLVCRVFGSAWLASKISIRDLLVDEDMWFGQFEVRNGVAIDRDTETASTGLLYDFEVTPAGTRFGCEIVVENAEDWELGLLMVGLRPFEQGEAALGGARSRGLGVVKIDWNSRTRVDKAHLLDWATDGAPATTITNDDVKNWIKKFRARLEGESSAQPLI